MTDVAPDTNAEPAASPVWIVVRPVDTHNVRLEPGDEVTAETLPESVIGRLVHFGVLINPSHLSHPLSAEDQDALINNPDAKAHLEYVNGILKEAREQLATSPPEPTPVPVVAPEVHQQGAAAAAAAQAAPKTDEPIQTEGVSSPAEVQVEEQVEAAPVDTVPAPAVAVDQPAPTPAPTPDQLREQALHDLLKEN